MNSFKRASSMKGIIVKKFGGVEELIVSKSLDIPSVKDNQVLL